MKPILLLVSLALCGRVALADDCASCTATKLCEAHVATDKEAAKALREGLLKADPAERISAIGVFAASCKSHANCRPVVNAQYLAAVLKDPDGAVRAKAAECLGSQDSKTVGPIFTKEVEPLKKKLEKEPKGAKEEAEWLGNFDEMKGICAGLAAMGTEDAGPAMVIILSATRFKVLDAACVVIGKVRASVVPPAMIGAIDRVRYSKPTADRDATWVALLKAWEVLTAAHLKPPDPTLPEDALRFVAECKAWWKINEKTWK